jgi:tRNA pseudouridine32 synthase / 23S rRNA pseudouridine746 synthase
LNDAFTRDGVGASRVFCPEGVWSSLFSFLCERFAAVSPVEWQARFESARVLNAQAQALRLDAPYIGKQTVYYFRAVHEESPIPYQATVLYQDDCLVVADKPHFLPVIPSGQYVKETLLVRLKRSLNLPNLVPLHRIDRDTAGIVMFCSQPKYRASYHALFRDGAIIKTYHALAAYREPLAQSLPISIINRLVTADNFMQMRTVPGAANTHTQVLAIEPLAAHPNIAQYTLRPHTGKRHQLRVHMLGLGVPIIGDGIYPAFLPERDICVLGHAPLQLLAQSLAFADPITGQERFFESRRRLELPASYS